jgi:hypothetical protein
MAAFDVITEVWSLEPAGESVFGSGVTAGFCPNAKTLQNSSIASL